MLLGILILLLLLIEIISFRLMLLEMILRRLVKLVLMGNHAPSTGADRTAIGTEAGNYEAGETGNITDGNSPGIDPAGSNEAA